MVKLKPVVVILGNTLVNFSDDFLQIQKKCSIFAEVIKNILLITFEVVGTGKTTSIKKCQKIFKRWQPKMHKFKIYKIK